MAIEYSEGSYEDRRYEELSKEFQEKWPTAARAFKLVALMYNRLTKVDEYTHKAAINKINNDHAHLPGFSKRNIRRYLPADNPNVPHRVRTPRPKTSITENDSGEKFSNSGLDEQGYGSKDGNIDSAVGSSSQGAGDEKDHKPREGRKQLPTIPEGNDCPNCQELRDKIKQLEEELEYLNAQVQARQEDEEFDRGESLANDDEVKKSRQPIDFEFCLKLRGVRKYAASRFREAGDNADVWFNGTIDPKTQEVVAAYVGKIEERKRNAAAAAGS
jgi:uncharacterized coiled-coil protein SlyX